MNGNNNLYPVVFVGAGGRGAQPRAQGVELVRGADQLRHAAERDEGGDQAADGARRIGGTALEALQRLAAAGLLCALAYLREVLPQACERTLDLGELGSDSKRQVGAHEISPSSDSSRSLASSRDVPKLTKT